MIHLKSMLMALGVCALSGVVNVAYVNAQTANSSPPQQQSGSAAVGKAAVPVTNVALANATPVKRGDRMICKEEPILGTRLKGMRTCRTSDEWRRVSRGFQAKLKEANDRGGAVYIGN